MWDNPRLLNAAANVLAGLAAAMLLFAAAHALLRSSLFPLREITVLATLEHTSAGEIGRATRAAVSGNFLAADLDAVRAALEQLPWVRRVQVRRVWPDRLEIALEDHVALALWGDAGLVNTYGERFAATSAERLPMFAGPAGAEAEVARRYRRFAELLAPLGEAPERVILTSRHAWRIRLTGGLNLELGRDLAHEPVERRLARFVAAYPQTLARMQRRHEYVDLRYPNGFALRVPELNG
ncbi:MAG TPA: cell division protein FtsQ/DivIB [Burkholderiales bacterium]|nr:cell division protein FtsQ/DivIB [Burkholderiales bacterium]